MRHRLPPLAPSLGLLAGASAAKQHAEGVLFGRQLIEPAGNLVRV
ncbi:MAG TPA: hypothetical protein VKI65_12565 [Gemmataceae bacterium]|nr:hypothetical protein [Gemmataceae bacterium]